MFSFRVLNKDDLSAFRPLFLEMTRDFPLSNLVEYEEALAFDDDHFLSFLNSGTRRGIFRGEELIGICGISHSPRKRMAHFVEVGPFFVTKSAHGSGAAGALMGAVADEARTKGADFLLLFVDAENFQAIKFYEKFGFRKVGEFYDDVRIDGVPRTDFKYRFDL